MQQRMKWLVLALIVQALWARESHAGSFALHQGANDPTTEGFSFESLFGPSSVGPVSNDMGYNAWNITALSDGTQAYYIQNFTAAQNHELATEGFTMTLLARVPGGPMNSPGANFYPSVDDTVDFGNGRRFDLALGLNTNGDTVAYLATSYAGNGGGHFHIGGPSYTLAGSGTGYQLYELVYDATTMTADLYIDGVDRISGYQGETQFPDAGGAHFGSDNAGQGNTSLFEVQSGTIPEPQALTLAAIAVVFGLATCCYRIRKPFGDRQK